MKEGALCAPARLARQKLKDRKDAVASATLADERSHLERVIEILQTDEPGILGANWRGANLARGVRSK